MKSWNVPVGYNGLYMQCLRYRISSYHQWKLMAASFLHVSGLISYWDLYNISDTFLIWESVPWLFGEQGLRYFSIWTSHKRLALEACFLDNGNVYCVVVSYPKIRNALHPKGRSLRTAFSQFIGGIQIADNKVNEVANQILVLLLFWRFFGYLAIDGTLKFALYTYLTDAI